MKRFLLLSLLVIMSCGKETPALQAPLDEPTMVKILADVHLAEALLTEYANKNQKDSLARVYYQQIATLNKVSIKDMEESMQAYFSYPDELKNLYEAVEKELDRMAKSAPAPVILDTAKSKPMVKKDSIIKPTLIIPKGFPIPK